MKKLILVCEILIALVFLAKFALLGGVLKTAEIPDHFISISTAAADSTTDGSHGTPAKNVLDDNLSEERKLLSALLEKHKTLDEREAYLKDEEYRLNSLKNEIVLAIGQLKELENNLTAQFETIKNTNDKKYKDLVKIYESAPAAWVGSMLEKLDTRTAAGIIMQMKNKTAGTVLGYLSPEKSLAITREFTRPGKTP